jgi:hypothetical protein
MTVRWDALLVRHLARELDGLLAGARLRALRLDASSRDLVLFLRERTVVWRLHPTRGSLLLRDPAEPGPDDLRLPMRVRAVTAPPDERLLRIQLLPARGGRRPMDVVVELIGNRWNALVAEGPEARIRHVLVTREGARTLAVGARWEPPPPSPRRGVDGDLPLEEWRALVAGASGSAARRTLVSSVAWTSPLNAPALLADPEAGWRLWKRLADPEAEASPVVLRTERGPHPYPVPLPHLPSEPAPTLVEALRRARTAEGEPEPGAALLLPPSLVRALDRTLDGLRRRLTSLQAEREGLADPDDLRATGDLLLARFHQVPAGAERVVLTDFAGEAVEVALDPTLPPQENADRYYDRAARAERARERIPALVARTRSRLEALETLEARVRAGEATREEVEAALPPEALRTGAEGGRGEDGGPSLPYRRFRSTGGLEIRVGKGPRENDDLTFHHSSPDDVWLHAQQVPGAHVILRWGRKETPPSRDLAEAAVLAALHSKARTSGSVPVQWTFRKYVRSPRKAPPGLVVPDRVRTVFVEPDAGVAERLSVEE